MALDRPGDLKPPGVTQLIPTDSLGNPFSAQQKEYLDGFLRALSGQLKAAPSPASSSGSAESEIDQPPGKRAQTAWIASGKRLSKEEKIKFDADPLDAWPRIAELAAQGKLPEGEDIFRFKTHGLWNVTPAQESMMCRLRLPGGILRAYQADAVAASAEAYGGGFVDITTRANLQIREIPGKHMASLLTDLHEAGVVPRGSGADNIRNVTGNPTCGIDAQEFYDVLPLCRQLHHAIMHDRTMYGLPRKFNVAFDGGSAISSLEDTNDIGFKAVKVEAGQGIEEGVYFRVALGGITGHGDLARDTGLLLKPEECIPVVEAMIRVYVMNGDRGNRKRARLKYVLDSWGFEKFLAETGKLLSFPLRHLPEAACHFAPAVDKAGHLGIHPQRQAGLCYMGVDVPVGRLTSAQLRGLAALSSAFGSGIIRLTVWQNLLISDIPEDKLREALSALGHLGLTHEPDPIQAGLVACTGSEGCKFGMAPTKSTALAISAHLRGKVSLDAPVNIHLTGCTHSCAQHFIGDIGLIAASVETPSYKGPGFHFFIGGGYGRKGRMAVPGRRSVPVPEVPAEVERVLSLYLEKRLPGESFPDFTAKRQNQDLQTLFAWPESSTWTEAEVTPASPAMAEGSRMAGIAEKL
ncbi:MAG: NirA family protein [Fibrobacterota bacterium]|nr:NirA family protein [Fibrobacterota bacterium]